MLKVPVIDHWWQTETGWAIAPTRSASARCPIKHGSPTVPMPGFDLQVLDENAHSRSRRAKVGALCRQAADAAGLPADAVESIGALPRQLS